MHRGESTTGSGLYRLWLVRHGATEWNGQKRLCGHTDIPLSIAGRREARWLAQQLRTQQSAGIYSSDLLRARQTADAIAQQSDHHATVTLDPGWREIYFGDWEGLTYAQIAAQPEQRANFFTDPVRYTPPGGESFSEFVQRVQSTFIRMLTALTIQAPRGSNAIIVSHGGPLRILLCWLVGIPWERQWQVRLDPGSLSVIDVIPGIVGVSPSAILALLNARRPERSRRSASSTGATSNGFGSGRRQR